MKNVKINIPLPNELLAKFDLALQKSKWSNRSQAIRTLISDWIRHTDPKKIYETNKDSKDIKIGDCVKTVNCPTLIDLNNYKIGFCKKFIHEEYWGFDICLFKYIEENNTYNLVSKSELQSADLERLLRKLSE